MSAAYLDLDLAAIRERVARARDILQSCHLCPRDCGAARDEERPPANAEGASKAYCGIVGRARVSSAFPHFGEEDCLRGMRGSGTIFFSGCNLKCVFCQNSDISHLPAGESVSARMLGALMVRLQDLGCHNINWVTPTHVLPHILEGLLHAVEAGLRRPIVYNTNAYDKVAHLRFLDGIVDIYMPDFKFWHVADAKRYMHAADYPDVARKAHLEMHRQVGSLQVDPESGLATRGVLVRHLVMPGKIDQSEKIFSFLARELSTETFVNIMAQYRPCHRAREYQEIDRCPTRDEILQAYRAARKAGLHRFDRPGF